MLAENVCVQVMSEGTCGNPVRLRKKNAHALDLHDIKFLAPKRLYAIHGWKSINNARRTFASDQRLFRSLSSRPSTCGEDQTRAAKEGYDCETDVKGPEWKRCHPRA